MHNSKQVLCPIISLWSRCQSGYVNSYSTASWGICIVTSLVAIGVWIAPPNWWPSTSPISVNAWKYEKLTPLIFFPIFSSFHKTKTFWTNCINQSISSSLPTQWIIYHYDNGRYKNHTTLVSYISGEGDTTLKKGWYVSYHTFLITFIIITYFERREVQPWGRGDTSVIGLLMHHSSPHPQPTTFFQSLLI